MMRLVGQFDSPFVRRVGITLAWYEMPFTQVPLSVFGDAEELSNFNPLRRVPALVLEDGTNVVDSFVCLEVADELARAKNGPDWRKLLIARAGPERLTVLRRCGLACGAADKVVSLVYEERVRDTRSVQWVERCSAQVRDTLLWLEQDYAASAAEVPGVLALSHSDVAITCLLTLRQGGATPGAPGSTPSALGGVARTLRNTAGVPARPRSLLRYGPAGQPGLTALLVVDATHRFDPPLAYGYVTSTTRSVGRDLLEPSARRERPGCQVRARCHHNQSNSRSPALVVP